MGSVAVYVISKLNCAIRKQNDSRREGKNGMPASEVMHKFKHGQLHSGSKKGPVVKNRAQAIAIMMSEKRKGLAAGGKATTYGRYQYGGGAGRDNVFPDESMLPPAPEPPAKGYEPPTPSI